MRPFVQQNGCIILGGSSFGEQSSQKQSICHLFGREGHEKILTAHRTSLDAGADVISSVSRFASFEKFSAAGIFTDGTLPGGTISNEKSQLRYSNDVLRASVELAKKARNEYWSAAQCDNGRLRPLVAASVGAAGENVALRFVATTDPMSADVPDAVASLYYRRKLVALCKAKPDLVAFEALPGKHEARIALDALAESAPELAKLGVAVPPVWISLYCTTDALTAAGDDIGTAAAELAAHPSVHAVGVNVVPSQLELFEPLLRRARDRMPSDALLLAYPHAVEAWDEDAECVGSRDNALESTHAVAMQRAGADGVGVGSCRASAAQLGAIRDALAVPSS